MCLLIYVISQIFYFFIFTGLIIGWFSLIANSLSLLLTLIGLVIFAIYGCKETPKSENEEDLFDFCKNGVASEKKFNRRIQALMWFFQSLVFLLQFMLLLLSASSWFHIFASKEFKLWENWWNVAAWTFKTVFLARSHQNQANDDFTWNRYNLVVPGNVDIYKKRNCVWISYWNHQCILVYRSVLALWFVSARKRSRRQC